MILNGGDEPQHSVKLSNNRQKSTGATKEPPRNFCAQGRYVVRTPAISEHPTIVSAAKEQHLPTPSAFSEPPHLRPTLSAKVPHKGEKMTSQRE